MTELLSQNDQVIEKKPNPIEELNTTMAQYYSVLHSKIYSHESNTDIHVTSDDKKIWNNKANQSDLESVKEYADSLKQSLDKVKPDIIKEVETMIDNSKDINLSDYATKVYVDAQIAALNISDDIATKTWVSNNFVSSTNYQRFDSTKYYTKDEIDNKIAGANVDNYQITEFSLANDYLNLTQNNGISTQVKLSDVSGGAITSDNLDRKLQDYLKISAIGNITFTRGGRIVTTWNPATENTTVELSGGSGADSQSGGYYKPYFKNYPSDDNLPTSQLPVVGQDPANAGWDAVNVNPEQGYFTWEIWVYIKTGGGFGDIIGPVCISGKDGDNGSDATGKEYIYQLNNNQPTKPTTKPAWGDVPAGWTDNPTGIDSTHRTEWMMYRTQDPDGVISDWLPAKGPVIWAHWGKDGTDGDGVQYIFCALKRGETTSVFTGVNDPTSWTNDSGFQNGKAGEYIKPGSRWTDNPIDIKTAVGYGQGSSQYVSIRRYRGSTGSAEDNDGKWMAYSEPSLWTYMAKDGESSSQTLKGSPLRNRGVWQTGVQYFDGTTQSDGGLFYQDFVSYTHSVVTDGASKNVTDFYVCKKQCASIVPTNTDYWDKLSDMGPIYTDVLVAMKAYIKELTAEEVIITDNENIVAGMTSGNSDKVSSQGNVRIWAGTNDKNASNIAEAPFTVTDKGVLTCRGNDGNIILKDGTIYFIVGGVEYKLGVTNGKPDWINSAGADSVEQWYTKVETEHNVSFSAIDSFSIKDNIYYTNGTMSDMVNGTYYKRASKITCLYNISEGIVFTFKDTFGIDIYIKATFQNGIKAVEGAVAISGYATTTSTPTQDIPGKINIDTTSKQWCSIEKESKGSLPNMYYTKDMPVGKLHEASYRSVDDRNVIYGSGTEDGIYVIKPASKETLNTDRKISIFVDESSEENVFKPTVTTVSL